MFMMRAANESDLDSITEIYNDAVLHTSASFDIEPKSREQQQEWFAGHNSQFPVLVAERDAQVIGWASLSKWSDRCAYSSTAEASLYIRIDERGKGTGRALLTELMSAGKKAGLHTVIARIVEGNQASIHLCESSGFIHIGTMKEVGRKFGKLLDVHLLQKIYPDAAG